MILDSVPPSSLLCSTSLPEAQSRDRRRSSYLNQTILFGARISSSNMQLSALAAVVMMLVYLLYRFIEIREEPERRPAAALAPDSLAPLGEIACFREGADGLVVDQMRNPGGLI